jgi:hypothetical protein
MHRGTCGLPGIGVLEAVLWRWLLVAGAGVGTILQLLLFLVIFGYVLASALVSVVVGQVVGLVYEPLYSEVVAKYLTLALAGGLLGGIESRATMSGQEAFYEASRAIAEAHSPQG